MALFNDLFVYKKHFIAMALAGLLLFGATFVVTYLTSPNESALSIPSPTPSTFRPQDTSLPNCQPSQMFESVDLALKNPSNVCALSVPSEALPLFIQNIRKFTNLKELVIVNQGLTELPSEIFALKKLLVLNVRSNKLTSLPLESLKSLNLSVIQLDGNPIAQETVKNIMFELPTTIVTYTSSN